MKYKVKLSYPTILKINEVEYLLFPGKEVELPESAEIVQTYMGLKYLEPLSDDTKKTKKGGVTDAS